MRFAFRKVEGLKYGRIRRIHFPLLRKSGWMISSGTRYVFIPSHPSPPGKSDSPACRSWVCRKRRRHPGRLRSGFFHIKRMRIRRVHYSYPLNALRNPDFMIGARRGVRPLPRVVAPKYSKGIIYILSEDRRRLAIKSKMSWAYSKKLAMTPIAHIVSIMSNPRIEQTRR